MLVKKTYKIFGMSCNSCRQKIENSLKDKVKSISVGFADEKAEIEFEESREKEIIKEIENLGYSVNEYKKENPKSSNKTGWIVAGISIILLLIVIYKFVGINLPEISMPEENASLVLLFLIGLLTGFHCISMCGGFVLSYTTKNALKGHKSISQHLVYGSSKVLSYTIIGGVFGFIGGIFAFSLKLRAIVAILAGLFMICYALGMLGIGFFKKFQLNPKFLSKISSQEHKGFYKAPFLTGILNGLFIACGPLQAMYIYAAGTGSISSGALSLFFFGLGTLPVMFVFGSVISKLSHKTTIKILKIAAIIVLILGLVTINRGLTLVGSSYSFSAIKTTILGSSSGSIITGNIQEINMDVDASGWKPNSFVLKKGIPVKWNINVNQLTGCNKQIVVPDYNLKIDLKQGKNLVEFTPEKEGTISWSCWMGMIPGNFIVTETGKANQEQIIQSNPKASAGCGGSCGGGCGGSGSCGSGGASCKV